MAQARIEMHFPPAEPFSYHAGSRALDSLGRFARQAPALSECSRALVISDANVAPLYGGRAKRALEDAGFRVDEICVPAGEQSKVPAVAGEIWQAMAQLGADRRTTVVALGGGVVGDLAGFVAATYMRGVPLVQVPTSLLAMIDSSIGGKTAIDLPQGKNLVGAFHQPACVCADTSCLETLPNRELVSGFGELAKTALLDSGDLFFRIDGATAGELRDEGFIHDAIVACALVKAAVVADDPEERLGLRECLNLGHTYGHALEALSGFGALSHGECVAEGIRFAAFAARRLLVTADDFTEAQGLLLDKLGLPERSGHFTVDETMRALRSDKKRRGGAMRLVLLRDLGQWTVEELSDEEFARLLAAWFERKDAYAD